MIVLTNEILNSVGKNKMYITNQPLDDIAGSVRMSTRLSWVCLLLAIVLLVGCAGNADDPMARRLAEMSNAELVSYHKGLTERLKDVQGKTVEEDRQGMISQEEPIAQMPYLFGGDGWTVEQKLKKVEKEMRRRNIPY